MQVASVRVYYVKARFNKWAGCSVCWGLDPKLRPNGAL